MKKQIAYIFTFLACFPIMNICFTQTNDDYPEDEHCTYSSITQLSTDSFYYYTNKSLVAVGTYETHCRLLCGGKSSFRFMYEVPKGEWALYYPNGTILAKGNYKVNSELGKDNRGNPEMHYFAEKTGTWTYYDIQGKLVAKEIVQLALDEAKTNLGYYNLKADWN